MRKFKQAVFAHYCIHSVHTSCFWMWGAGSFWESLQGARPIAAITAAAGCLFRGKRCPRFDAKAKGAQWVLALLRRWHFDINQFKGYRPCRRPLMRKQSRGMSNAFCLYIFHPHFPKIQMSRGYVNSIIWRDAFCLFMDIWCYFFKVFCIKRFNDARDHGMARKVKRPGHVAFGTHQNKTEKKVTSSKEAKTCGPDNGSVPKLRKRPSCLEQGKPLRNLRLRSLWKTSAQRQKAALEKLQPPGKA